jgi:hypothetical protein
MVEKDVEYSIKNIILNNTDENITITNEFLSDGIVRYGNKPVAILEFKNKKNFTNEATAAQVLTQAMCYYYKLVSKETIDYTKPFYLIIGDDNEVMVMNLHKLPNNWLMNSKWGTIAPSKAAKEADLFEVASSMFKLIKPVYYKYEDLKELYFGFHLIFSGLIN